MGGRNICGCGDAPLVLAVGFQGVDGDVYPAGGGDTGGQIGSCDSLSLREMESCDVELFLVEKSKTL